MLIKTLIGAYLLKNLCTKSRRSYSEYKKTIHDRLHPYRTTIYVDEDKNKILNNWDLLSKFKVRLRLSIKENNIKSVNQIWEYLKEREGQIPPELDCFSFDIEDKITSEGFQEVKTALLGLKHYYKSLSTSAINLNDSRSGILFHWSYWFFIFYFL